MSKIVYAKYSNERDDKFKIKTVIEQDDSGKRYVKKYAMTEAAMAHIAGIVQHEKKLTQCAAGTKLHFNHCTLEDSHIDCEYVKGEPLSAILNRKITQKDTDGALELIREYCDLLQQMATEPFVATDAFEQVFGKVEFSGEQKSCKVTDIDLIFSNILVDGDRWNAIDLEWTFDFPVPVNYLIYRSIMNSVKDVRDFFLERWDFDGISQSDIPFFSQMDHAFLSYVKGEEVQLYRLENLQIRKSISDLNAEVADLNMEVTNLNLENEKKACQIQELNKAIATISSSRSWRITAPLRKAAAVLHGNRYMLLVIKGIKSLKNNGFHTTWAKVKNKLFLYAREYRKKANRQLYTEAQLCAQRKEKFPRDIKISILVPLYNTPEKFLREMISSVLDQTYANWELCLADGSDNHHSDVGRISMEYVEKDQRIHYKKLERNLGISGNTNACIEMSSGDYIALFDHDDILHPAALHDVMTEICEKNADFVYTDEATFESPNIENVVLIHYKPDYAPDTLRSYNYICHLSVFSRKLLEKAGGGFRQEFDGSQDYDLILRLTEQAERIVHIPKALYYWRSHANSVAQNISAKPYTLMAAKNALSQHLARVGLKGQVLDSSVPSTYKIAYEIKGEPLISILIPNKDHIDDLKKCLDSVRKKSTYRNWEIIVIENNSTEKATFDYYAEIKKDRRIRVVTWPGGFNFSAINNFGAQYARGEYILLLNNDVEVITPDWLEQMLMFAQRDDVGAVGAMLYYPDDTVQHAGVILGIGGVAGCSHKYFQRGSSGYMSRMSIAQNYTCVTAACHLMRRNVWDEIGGLDKDFAVAFNDVDLCMRIRQAGYLIVWTPYAELYHYESKSRGLEDTPEKQQRFQGEVLRFQARWRNELAAGDPYYNPNLTLVREDFSPG